MKNKSIFTRASKADITILEENNDILLTLKKGETPLHRFVTRGGSFVKHLDKLIAHPLISVAAVSIKLGCPNTPRWTRYFISKNQRIFDKTINEINEVTPLHILAKQGMKEVLDHPQVATLKDSLGNTPLHYLAMASQGRSNKYKIPLWKLIFKHPDIHKVKNNFNKTPLEVFNVFGHPITIGILKKILSYVPAKYTDDQRVSPVMWKEILSTPNSIRFILED